MENYSTSIYTTLSIPYEFIPLNVDTTLSTGRKEINEEDEGERQGGKDRGRERGREGREETLFY